MAGLATRRDRQFWPGWLGCMLLASGLGTALVWFPFGQGLRLRSYEAPFRWVDPRSASSNIFIIRLDAASARQLHQPSWQPWDRALHARLLEKLTAQGARAVFFDVVFGATNAATDAALADAIRRHGRVVLGARMEAQQFESTGHLGQRTARTLGPNPELDAASADRGLINIRTNFTCRPLPLSETNQAALVLARLLGHPVPSAPVEPWLNWRGPGGTFDSLPYQQALETGADYFRDKIVFIGAEPAKGFHESEAFATPFSRFGHGATAGVEIHATWFDNLQRGDWLMELPAGFQALLVAGLGLLLSVIAMRGHLLASALAVVGVVAVVVVGSHALHLVGHRWWNWLAVPVAAVPALGWAVGYRYFVMERHRARLRRAFGHYLSPEMAARIDENRLSLEPGNGVVCEATVLFTDLKGYSGIAETLPLPEVGQLLSAYYEQITGAILRRGGTIIKYVGDSVMAVWGAPVADAEHARHAVEAALEIAEANTHEFRGHRLPTRLGLCTGPVLAGNLGSSFRFDYTAIGNTTNTAARLEGLNKQLGTALLIADATRTQLGDGLTLRCVGRFVLAGKQEAVAVYEVLGPSGQFEPRPEWLAEFVAALTAWDGGQFAEARQRFTRVSELRGQADGPSQFYLARLPENDCAAPVPAGWTGEIVLSAK